MKRAGFRRPTGSPALEYARAQITTPKTPWRRANYCVVDLELSGLDPREDEIISFGAVPIDAGRLVAGSAVYGICRPSRPLVESSILIHGIRTVDLADAPPLDEAVQPLITAMTGRVIVAHVARVERAFLSQMLRRQGVRLRGPILDTYELGRLLALQRREPSPRRTLDELAEYLGLPIYRRHHALGDALTTAQVFLALATHLDEFTPETVRSLDHVRDRVRLLSA
ncbi:MAG: 3'-5' exonuclease [Acidimicrobiales bacterium]